MIDVNEILSSLASKRPIFHSEADFQHALAWEIHSKWLECSMRLEYRPPRLEERIYLDIWAAGKDAILAIELKYKTRLLYIKTEGETFELADQAAQDLARYDFLKDIQRLERTISHIQNAVGYALFLTNDSAYWKSPMVLGTVDESFRIHQGKVITGELRWGSKASQGTTRTREKSITIKGWYKLNWQDYSEPSDDSYGKFRYLSVRIDRAPSSKEEHMARRVTMCSLGCS